MGGAGKVTNIELGKEIDVIAAKAEELFPSAAIILYTVAGLMKADDEYLLGYLRIHAIQCAKVGKAKCLAELELAK